MWNEKILPEENSRSAPGNLMAAPNLYNIYQPKYCYNVTYFYKYTYTYQAQNGEQGLRHFRKFLEQEA